MPNNVVKFLITGDSSSFVNAGKAGEAAITKLGSTASSSSQKATKNTAALSIGTIAAGAAVVAFGKKSIDAYDAAGRETLKLERLTGGTAEQMSGLRFAATQSGVSFNTLAGSVSKFSKSFDTPKVAAALDQIGVSATDASGKTRPYFNVLKDLSDKFETMPPGIEKNKLAMQLFGKAGADMEPLLNKGSKGIDDLIKHGKDLGVVFSNTDDIKAQVKAQREFQASIQGLEIQIGKVLTPVLTEVTGVLSGTIEKFTKLSPTVKTAIEVVGGLALAGVAVGKAWGLAKSGADSIKTVFSDVSSAAKTASGFVKGLGSAATAAGAETATASVDADASISSIGVSARSAAAQTKAASAEAAASITSLGDVAAGTAALIEGEMSEADAAIASLGSTAQAGAADYSAALATFAAENDALIGSISSVAVAAQRMSSITIESMSEADAAIASLGFTAQTTAGVIAASSAEAEVSLAGIPKAAEGGRNSIGGLVGAFSNLGAGGKVAALGIVTAIAALVTFHELAGSVKDTINDTQIEKGFDPARPDAFNKSIKNMVNSLDDLANRNDVFSSIGQSVGLVDDQKDGFDRLNESLTNLAKTSPQAAREYLDAVEKGFAKKEDGLTGQKGYFDEIRKSINDTAGAARGSANVNDQYADAFGKVKRGINDATSALDLGTSATEKNAEAAGDASKLWTAYANTLHGIADPVFGAITAQQSLVKAQQAVYFATVAQQNALRQSGKDSQAYRDATDALSAAQSDSLTATLGQQSALSSLQASFLSGATSVEQMKSTLQGWVAQGDITQDTANGVIGQLGILKQKADAIPSGIPVNVTTTGAPAALSVLDRVKAFIGQIPPAHDTVITANANQANATITSLIGRLAGLAGPSTILGFSIGGKAPTGPVAHKAKGGILRGGTIAEVAEGGYPEIARVAGRTYFLSSRDAEITPASSVTSLGSTVTPQTSTVPEATALLASSTSTTHVIERLGSQAVPVAPSGGSPVVIENMNLYAAPGEDAYTFGRRVIDAITAVERTSGSAWRDVPVR